MIFNPQKEKDTTQPARNDSRVFRFFTSVILLVGFWMLMSRAGFLPRLISAPYRQKIIVGELGKRKAYMQPDIATNSIFYYTGNSFRNLINESDQATLEPGTIDTLDFFGNNNLHYHGYYDIGKDTYYSIGRKEIYSSTNKGLFSSKKNSSKLDKAKRVAVFDTKTDEAHENTVFQYRGVYLVPVNGSGVEVVSNASRDRTVMSNPNTDRTNIADILYRNKTENISLEDLCRVVHSIKRNELYNWNPNTNEALFLVADGEEEKFCIINAETGTTSTFNPTADLSYDGNFIYTKYDDKRLACVDYQNNKVFIWDIAEDSISNIVDIPESIDGTVRFRKREDGSFIAAGLRNDTHDIWVYVSKTNEFIEYESPFHNAGETSLILGTHSVAQIFRTDSLSDKAWKHKIMDFSESLKK